MVFLSSYRKIQSPAAATLKCVQIMISRIKIIIITTILHDKSNVRIYVSKQGEIASLVSNYRESILKSNYKNTTKIGKQLSVSNTSKHT